MNMFASLYSIFAILTMNSTNHTVGSSEISSSDIPSSIGGFQDTHGCILGAGYQWCDAHQACERLWVTPCPDTVALIDDIDFACPEVMCMMYCPYGNVIDDNGCSMCQCHASVTPPVSNEPIRDMNSVTIPEGCQSWYDGCNICDVGDEGILGCSMMMCLQNGDTECRAYRMGSGH